MSDLWARLPEHDRSGVIINSLALREYREAARDNHLAMRRRYDFGPSRLVWDFGEYNAPGLYGILELNSFGKPSYAELFGYKFEGDVFDDLDVAQFFYGASEEARQTVQVVVVPKNDDLLHKIPTEEITVPAQLEGMRFQYDHNTGDITLIQRMAKERQVPVMTNELPIAEPDAVHERNLAIEADGRVTPRKHSWTWFLIMLCGGMIGFFGLVYAIVAHRPAWAAFISLALVCDVILLFAIMAYYDDVKDEAEQIFALNHRHRS